MKDAPTFEGRLYTDGELNGRGGRWVRRAEYDFARDHITSLEADLAEVREVRNELCAEITGLTTSIDTLRSTLRSMVNAWEPDEGGSDYRLWLCAKSVLRDTSETPAEPEKCPHGILWRGPVCMDCVNEAFGHQSKTKTEQT